MIPTLAFAGLLVAHGLIHLLGFARAFDLAEVPLSGAVGPGEGFLWLAAGLLLTASGVALFRRPRWWWVPALVGIVLSQGLILGAWEDARWGSVANLVILVPLLVAAADHRPGSLRSIYRREAAREAAARAGEAAVVGDNDLEGLPAAVRTWLRRAGVVGRPVPRSVHAAFRIRIRGATDEPWMEGRADQYGFVDPPARLFFMTARKAGLPVHVLHRYQGAHATMEGRLLGLVPLFRREGPEMTRSETVTLLNDLFFLVPAALVRADVAWEVVDEGRVRATWTHAGHTVSGVAVLDPDGDLVDFESRDRFLMDRDPPLRSRWSTPFRGHRSFDGIRLPAGGEGRWGEPAESWPYVEIEVTEVGYDEPPEAR